MGVKIGDVNNTAIANSLMSTDDRSTSTLLFDVQDRMVKAGEVFEVTFKGAEKVQGYQFTLNLAGLEVTDILETDGVKRDNFGVFADALTTSVDGAGEFTVKFRASRPGRLSEMLGVSSRITRAEAYGLTNDRKDVALRFNNGTTSTIAGVGFELYQNQPNPFVNKTMVGFHLPEATEATLTVYDETGRMLFTQKGQFGKGYNAIAIDRALLNTTGVMYYKLETATDAATKKMIQTK
ncbi:MAG: T9SS type A sorting domain-containing protein [Lewinellaceae bacterium]|nr:T9SS type A sorting domain-containing protein [Lewinellaceae bacterium]